MEYWSELKVQDCTIVSGNAESVFITHPLFSDEKEFVRYERTKKKIWYRHDLNNGFGFQIKADIGR